MIIGDDDGSSDLAVITIDVDPASSGGGSSGGTPAPVETPMDVSAGDENYAFSNTNYNDTVNGGGNDRIPRNEATIVSAVTTVFPSVSAMTGTSASLIIS
ncbi:hypothetical protein [Phaeobacter gallaeciensis]|uniref:Uncharacterized protein n=1 Tax=Phaeobacter gallaeciensis TaxID=60890 RepID=A0AAD0EET3_9RHOB|nr:hypothetical protein [Phaeobacter gallaeciensis]AHD11557.1 hypothetical protein Gal_03849 [Phaeobacter gallaeciensis DSM 26640]ATE94821.1 hypothetical protein PhaeoP11_03835 [Phaeobacter gallaeciensis]ATF03485.1 hypothetical protein PhaeoP75_03884 [Phaeobacter gallaeciensis]ATF07865.1 hypothetical protein PhaeoP63_03833 [Phaeobacter gallaeciensis]